VFWFSASNILLVYLELGFLIVDKFKINIGFVSFLTMFESFNLIISAAKQI
jgi:hypothetical protein